MSISFIQLTAHNLGVAFTHLNANVCCAKRNRSSLLTSIEITPSTLARSTFVAGHETEASH
jgi:hypothetical protein